MKKILAITLSILSSSALADNYNGVWAINYQSCKNDWIKITPKVISGKNSKCKVSAITESETEKVISTFCGYDSTDVTFQDIMKLSNFGGYLIITYEEGKTGLVNCK